MPMKMTLFFLVTLVALCATTGAVGIESERQYDDITDVIDGDPDGEVDLKVSSDFPNAFLIDLIYYFLSSI